MLKLVLLLSLFALPLLAHGGEEEGPDPRGREFEREVRIAEEHGDRIRVESRTRDPEDRTRFNFEIDTEDGTLELRLEYFARDSDSDDTNRYRLRLERILEFVDNGDAGFQPSDQIVDQIDFHDRRGPGPGGRVWADLSCNPDGNVFTCTATTVDGQLSVVAYITSNETGVNGVPIRPTGLKFDVHIDKTERQNGTKIALVVRFQGRDEMRARRGSREHDEGFVRTPESEVSFGESGFFSWAETATIGTHTLNVLNSGLEAANADNRTTRGEMERSRRISFTFDSTEHGAIFWDPKVGMDVPAAAVDSSAYFALPSLFLVLLALFFSRP